MIRRAAIIAAMLWLPILGFLYALRGLTASGPGGVSEVEALVALGGPWLCALVLLRQLHRQLAAILCGQFGLIIAGVALLRWSACLMAYDAWAHRLGSACDERVPAGLGFVWIIVAAISVKSSLSARK